MNAQNLLVETAKMMDVVDIQTCYYIYKVCNGRQWEPIPCSDFIGIMNMKETQASIHILHREKVRACYLIYATSKHLAFPALEKYMQEQSETFDNSNSKRWQFHIALSVKGTELDKEELADIADRFMQAFGYGKQPYLVYFHHDTDNNHLHILSTNINRFGSFINDSFDKDRMVPSPL